MIACDIDGTLLNKNESIGPTVSALIKQIVQQDIQFVLITRRHHDAAEVFADQLLIDTPIISLDGAMTRRPHVPVPMHVRTFDQDFARDIIEEIRMTDAMEFCAITSDRLLISQQDMALPAQHEFWNIETRQIDGAEEIEDVILEIAATGDFFGVNRVYDYIVKRMRRGELRVRVYESHHKGGKWHLELRSSKATKLTALEVFLNEVDIPIKDVIGIGDHYNDVDFCKKTGYVVTVRNAIRQMKEIADFVTTLECFDDGIGEFFDAFLQLRGVDTSEIMGRGGDRPRSSRKRSR